MEFSRPEELSWIELGGGSRRKIRAYNKDIMLVEVDFDEGGVGADHSHPHAQISYILSGEFTYHVEEKTYTMKRGDSVVVDGGRVHGLTCLKAGTVLDVFTPLREDFIK